MQYRKGDIFKCNNLQHYHIELLEDYQGVGYGKIQWIKAFDSPFESIENPVEYRALGADLGSRFDTSINYRKDKVQVKEDIKNLWSL